MATAQRSTIVGVFDDYGQAEKAIRELQEAGFPSEQLGFAMRDRADGSAEAQGGIGGALAGGVAGRVVGGVFGGLLGAAVSAAIPGFGLVVGAGVLALIAGGRMSAASWVR